MEPGGDTDDSEIKEDRAPKVHLSIYRIFVSPVQKACSLSQFGKPK